MDHDVRAHADRWLEAWNNHDLDGILSGYAEDVVFTAPTVVSRWDRPDGTLRGIDELRSHFARGLELAPGLRFDEEELLQTVGGYALLYRRENGNRVIDAVQLNAAGEAARVHAFYASHQA